MRKPQKYQNKKAFKLEFAQDKIDLRDNVPLNNLCDRCYDIIAWKLNFGKYRKMGTPGKCHSCLKQVVIKSYREHCDRCSNEKMICSKCATPCQAFHDYKKKVNQTLETNKKVKAMEDVMSTFQERSRRKIHRLIKLKNIDFVDGVFLYLDTGLPIEVHLKGSIQKEFGSKKDGEEGKDGGDGSNDDDLDDDDLDGFSDSDASFN